MGWNPHIGLTGGSNARSTARSMGRHIGLGHDKGGAGHHLGPGELGDSGGIEEQGRGIVCSPNHCAPESISSGAAFVECETCTPA